MRHLAVRIAEVECDPDPAACPECAAVAARNEFLIWIAEHGVRTLAVKPDAFGREQGVIDSTVDALARQVADLVQTEHEDINCELCATCRARREWEEAEYVDDRD